jgi:methylglutaconyl-CoA hydratase
MSSVHVVKEGYCLIVTLNRPDVHNAFEPGMIKELTEIFKNAPADKSLRCILLKGNGKSFCAGADLEWMKSMVDFDLDKNTKDSTNLFQMFQTMSDCELPIVARIQGNIMGGGLGLIAVCDIVGADKDSRFAFSETRLGLVPSVISSFVLRKAAASLVRELMLTAEVFGCDLAGHMGLLQFYGDSEEADDFVQSKLDYLCSNGPEAVRITKNILNFQETHNATEVAKETIKVISERRVSAEGQEGIKAFLEKRKPSWIKQQPKNK